MFKRLAAIALLFGVVLVSAKIGAKTYTLTISEKTVAGNTELKPGEYRIRLEGAQAVVTDQNGKQLDITGTVETAEHKFDVTSAISTKAEGTNRLVAVQLGGTSYKIVFQ